MRRTIVKTFSPDFADFDSSSSALRDGADELVALVLVEVADAQVARLDERAEAADEPVAELALGGADRAAELVVELDGQVGDALGGQVGGDVDLATAHDAEVDHGAAGLGVEAVVGGREPGLLEPAEQRGRRLVAVDPAEELPDRPEVVDVVDERGAGEREQQRVAAGSGAADAVGEREHVASSAATAGS